MQANRSNAKGGEGMSVIEKLPMAGAEVENAA